MHKFIIFGNYTDKGIKNIKDSPARLSTAKELAKEFKVVSEVGSKDENKLIAPYKLIELMHKELSSGAWKVIAESRESGNVGIYNKGGDVRSDLIDEILTKIPNEDILW